MRDLVEHGRRVVEVNAEDLPLHCPPGKQVGFNGHPLVFLSIEQKGEIVCPYCGTLYRLKEGLRAREH